MAGKDKIYFVEDDIMAENQLKGKIFNKKTICIYCGKEFEIKNYRANKKKLCSLECETNRKKELNHTEDHLKKNRIRSKVKYDKIKETNPLKIRAMGFKSRLQWGKNATLIMIDFMNEYLNKPCEYCGILLNLENISLDHKIPIKFKTTKKDPLLFKELNKKENLHFICKTCNLIKGTIPHEQFLIFIEFLNKNPELKNLLISRLKSSYLIYRNLKWKR